MIESRHTQVGWQKLLASLHAHISEKPKGRTVTGYFRRASHLKLEGAVFLLPAKTPDSLIDKAQRVSLVLPLKTSWFERRSGKTAERHTNQTQTGFERRFAFVTREWDV